MLTQFRVTRRAQVDASQFPSGTIFKSDGVNVAAAVAGTDYQGIQSQIYNNGYSGSAKTVTWTNGRYQLITLTSATVTLTFVPPASVLELILLVTQSGNSSSSSSSGAADLVTWPAAVRWVNATAPTLSIGTGKTDLIKLFYDGTYYRQVAVALNV